MCAACRAAISQPTVGRPRQYCSPACRQRAWASKVRPKAHRSQWYTPEPLRSQVLNRWPITLDAAADQDSHLVPNYIGLDHPEPGQRDALAFDDWTELAAGGTVWLNPPYQPSNYLSQFLERAVTTAHRGTTVVGLLPASTGTRFWWDHVIGGGAEIEFLRGRLTFQGPHADAGTPAPWASALVTWKGTG